MACLLLVFATPANADFGIESFTGGAFNQDGTSMSQAAGHPDHATTTFMLNAAGPFQPDGHMKDVAVDLPPGFVGNPEATPTLCRRQDVASPRGDASSSCPGSSQVGVATIYAPFPGFPGPGFPLARSGVYNVAPRPGAPAEFALLISGQPAFLVPRLRTGGDYGITVDTANIVDEYPVAAVTVSLWGVPADPSHDAERLCAGRGGAGDEPPPCPVDAPRIAFLTTPSDCAAGPLTTTLRVASWQDPDVFHTASFDQDSNGNPTAVTGCEAVPFEPDISVRPTSTEADGPTGLDVDLVMPTDGLLNPDGLAQSPLKRARVTLPEGMTINPSAASGLQGCTDAQLDIDGPGPATCPDAAKVGTVSIETPLLDKPLAGGVYVRSQASDDPASGEMFRIAIVIDDEQTGLRIKLGGRVAANLQTGQLVTTFDDNPQVPFSRLSLRLNAGSRAPLAMPPTCGEKTIESELTSWSGKTVAATQSFTIACPGQSGFSPSFEAGALSPAGGAFSPFVARIARDDGEQYLSGVAVDMPQGLIAKLRGVELCPDGVAGDGTPGACPAGSRVGTATVGVGSGADPFFLKGEAFLTGPYRGGPYGLSVAVHAKAGPFDLGVVKVRQAIHVDPETAEISIVSDPLPQIVKGVPVRLRSVNVDVDRPGFTINPTSCAEKRIDATLTSAQGAVHKTGTRFQVGDCRALPFRPRLAMRLTGRKQRRTGGHPGLRVRLTQGSGQANLKGLTVKLPPALALDPDNANGLCSFEEARQADPKCPASSIVGRATAYTPVLNKPLSGPVYFAEHKQVNRFGRLISKLPSLVIALRGEVAINIRQRSDVKGGRLISTTATIPDAPVSRFNLRLKGGAGGIITVTRNAQRRFDICKGRQTALVESDGQNGRRADYPIRAKTPCGKKAKSGKAKRTGSKRR